MRGIQNTKKKLRTEEKNVKDNLKQTFDFYSEVSFV